MLNSHIWKYMTAGNNAYNKKQLDKKSYEEAIKWAKIEVKYQGLDKNGYS